MIITIDGPVASGKSSVAKKIAAQLGIYYLHTGLLYRALAAILTSSGDQQNLSNPQQETIQEIVKNISYDYNENSPILTYKKKDITASLHASSLDQAASQISSNKIIRDALLDLQKDIGARYDIIAEGRDCGSVVFPDADIKFFLTADIAVRAERYRSDSKRMNAKMSLDQAKKLILERDERDKTRDISPLIVPDDAIVIDNSTISETETIKCFISHIEDKGV